MTMVYSPGATPGSISDPHVHVGHSYLARVQLDRGAALQGEAREGPHRAVLQGHVHRDPPV